MSTSEWTDFIAALVDSAVWPIFVALVAWWLRPGLLGLLGAIRDRVADPATAVALQGGPLGVGLTTQQLGGVTESPPSDEAPDLPVAEGAVTLTAEQVRILGEGLGQIRGQAWTWHFEYLIFGLATSTKSVLKWLALQSAPPTEDQVWVTWGGTIPDVLSRTMTISVLLQHDLATKDDQGRLSITDRGRQFNTWVDARVATQPVPPFLAYGVGLTAGDVVKATVGGTDCGSTTVNAKGEWVIQISATAPVKNGDTIDFWLNGAAAEQTAVYTSGNSVSGEYPGPMGVPLTVADAS